MFENLSNQKKINLFLIFSTLFLIFFIYQLVKPNTSDNKFVIRDIRTSFDGIILKKVDVRINLFLHVKISRKNKFDTLIDIGHYTDSIYIGDRIMKQKNSPFFYVLSKERSPKKYIFTLIPEHTLNSDEFPKAWKDSCKSSWKKIIFKDSTLQTNL